MFKGLAGRLNFVRSRDWPPLLIAIVMFFVVFLWRLGSLTAGLSPAELLARKSSSSLSAIISNPINAPHKLLQFGLHKLQPEHIWALRLPSVIFALIIGFCFYRIAVSWFGRAIGLFGSLIFVSLPLLVISARQATPEILFFAPIILTWLYVWLLKTEKHKSSAWLLLMISAATLIYTPGMLIWAVGGFIVCRKRINSAISGVPALINASGLLVISLSAVSLGLACLKHPSVLKSLFLVPQHFPSISPLLKHLGWMVLSLFVKTSGPTTLGLGRLPVLNILLVSLLVFGVYALQGAARLKAILLSLSVLFAIMAAGLNNNISLLAYGLPSIGIFIAAGLRYLYIEWRSIFPRNPVPKTFALALIAVVTIVQVYFGLRYSLVAWPDSGPTRSVYVLK